MQASQNCTATQDASMLGDPHMHWTGPDVDCDWAERGRNEEV